MKKYIIIVILETLCSLTWAKSPTVRMTVQVTDDQNKPIPNAQVGFGGGLETPDEDGVSRKANGQADAKGEYTATIASLLGRAGAFAVKEGYYRTEHDYIKLYKTQEEFEKAQKSGKWQPWDQTLDVVIKPIKNPIPMYVKDVTGDIPVKNQWIGYDLEVGDWVGPYGRGIKSDFEFFAEGKVQGNTAYQGSLKLRFTAKGDGILSYEIDAKNRSAFKSPYEAPTQGYQSTWNWKTARYKSNDSKTIGDEFVDESDPDRGFIFRIRTIMDANGNIISANYGKIYGPFVFDPRGTNGIDEHCFISFRYYFNPDKTRNLEFDPKHNLFSGQNIQIP